MLNEKGFTLIELLVSVLILTFVILAASMLFTQAQWYHLGAEKRSDVQDHARVIIETMERDLRMIGYGVPTGANVGVGGGTWDAIFSASANSIGFTADIDNGHTILTADAAATSVSLHDATYYADVATNPLPVLLVNNGKQWIGLTANSIAGNVLTTTTNSSPSTFTSEKGEIFTMERVFYRMTGDSDANGICDSGYPFCKIERQEFTTNDPTTETANGTLWETLGEYVFSLDMEYQNGAGTVLDPSVATNLPSIEKIVITLVCTNRWLKVGEYQNVTLTSNVLVRNRAL